MTNKVYSSVLMEETNSYVELLPQFVDAIIHQKEGLFWTDREIKIEKDEQDLKHNLLSSQVHALTFNQRLFTKYEDVIGNDYWIGVVHKRYKNSEIRRLAVCFADVENNIHFPFYRRVNEVLGTHSDEFYNAFETDPVLIQRVKFMQELVSSKDTLESMGAFAFMEGAVLFTAFAMIKSLGVKGQTLMPNLIAGINMSVLDENFHMQTACEIFKVQLEMEGRTEEDVRKLKEKLYKHAEHVVAHEDVIVDAMLSEGDIPFASKAELKAFARHRVNVVLCELGLPELAVFDETGDTISEWFYKFMEAFTHNDNFYNRGRNYKKEYTHEDYNIFNDKEAVQEVLDKLPDGALEYLGIDVTATFDKTLQEELDALLPPRSKRSESVTESVEPLYVPDYSKERKSLQQRGEAPQWMATAGWQLFKKKYLNGDAKTPKDQYLRIAKTLASYMPDVYPDWWNEIEYWKGKSWEEAFFSILWDGYLSPSTPVLSNTGTDFGMSVSCSGAGIVDSVEGFYNSRKVNALLSKQGFGTTIDLSPVRGRGMLMNGGTANGALPVAKMFRQDALDISQGSNRRGAVAWYYHADGLDFEELQNFLEFDTDGNNGGWKISNQFMNRALIGDSLAIERWCKIVNTRHHVGLGYKFYIDKVNARRPQMYKDRGLEVKTSNLCVAPETKILTDKGHLTISELHGQKVNVWNGEEWSEVEVVKTSEMSKLITVDTEDGYKLDCTEYHKFYVVESYGNVVEKAASELSVGDKLVRLRTEAVEGTLELSKPYENGFYSGDGCEVNGSSRIYLYGDKVDLLDNFEGIRQMADQPNQNRMYFYVDGLMDKFFVPDAKYTISSRLSWLAGILDSDGCVLRNGDSQTIQVASATEGFLEDVQMMLQTLGVQSKVRHMRDAGDFELPKNDGSGDTKLYPCRALKRLLISSEGINNLLSLGLSTSRLKFCEHTPNRNATRFVQVKSVVDAGRHDATYCFTEPKRHMGVFNGILTGQCSEITLFSDENHTFTCVLSSENLMKFDSRPKNLAFVGAVFLDCVAEDFIQRGSKVDGLETAVEFTRKSRALGYGTMSFASYLMSKGIPYGSLESFWRNKEIYSTIDSETKEASKWMATVLGEPEWCVGYGVRNTHLVSLAPTKSTGLLMGGYSEGINVPPALLFAQDTPAGTVYRIEPVFLQLMKDKGLYVVNKKTELITKDTDKLLKRIADNLGSIQGLDDVFSEHEQEVFRTAYEIDQYKHIDLCAQRQPHIDQAQSINVFLANKTAKEIMQLYLYASLNPNILSLYYHTGLRDTRIASNKNECEACM